MNRASYLSTIFSMPVPRVSGDEPVLDAYSAAARDCSPRERG